MRSRWRRLMLAALLGLDVAFGLGLLPLPRPSEVAAMMLAFALAWFGALVLGIGVGLLPSPGDRSRAATKERRAAWRRVAVGLLVIAVAVVLLLAT